jgi:hypothetical protein
MSDLAGKTDELRSVFTGSLIPPWPTGRVLGLALSGGLASPVARDRPEGWHAHVPSCGGIVLSHDRA